MSLLNRYRKSGGFLQLLQLVETSPVEKKEKFLDLIKQENPKWAEAIQQKMLTIDRICSWPHDTLKEVTEKINELNLIVLKEALPGEQWSKIFETLSERRAKSFEEMSQYRDPPNEGEINTAHLTLLNVARMMITQGFIYPEHFDQSLIVPDGIEDTFEDGYIQKEVIEEKLSKFDQNLRAMKDVELRAEVRRLHKELQSAKVENEKLRALVAKLPKSA